MIGNIIAFLVPPLKVSVKAGKQIEIVGTEIPLYGRLFNMLEDLFKRSHKECEIPIHFIPEEGEQYNEIRANLLNYIENRDFTTAEKLALRLAGLTDNTMRECLLFFIYAEDNDNRELVLSRFPAEQGVVTSVTQRQLTVDVAEDIFLRGSHRYKAVLFSGRSLETDFWDALAVDKQVGGTSKVDRLSSDYWIKDFLKADFKLTSKRGSMIIGKAIRQAVAKTASLSIKHQLTSIAPLTNQLNDQLFSINDLLVRFGISEETKNHLFKEIENPQVIDQKFIFNNTTFQKYLNLKVVFMDNGAIVSGPTESFDKIWEYSETSIQNEIEYKTKGKIIDEKIRTRI